MRPQRWAPVLGRPRALAILGVVLLSGCTLGGGAGNPNLAAPKLVVGVRSDGNATIFVHGAFREQVYDWIEVAVNNETLTNRTEAYSAEATLAAIGFFLDVKAGAGSRVYQGRARLDIAAAEERVRVATNTADGWSDARTTTLPYELILDRPEVSP